MIQHAERTPAYRELEPDFQDAIDAITTRQLSAETIDRYAEEALEDLVSITERIINRYETQLVVYTAGQQKERDAFSYYDLNATTIEETLDHIANKAEEIRNLDEIIERITVHAGIVITPPDAKTVSIEPGDGSFSEKSVTSRLKTVLFLLAANYGVDLTDPSQCSVADGILKDAMMRRESYKLIELPQLNRTILVCDEDGNATFVFDTEKLNHTGVTKEILMSMTKDELRDIIALNQAAGVRLVYSEKFVEHIAGLLDVIPEEGEPVPFDASAGRLLQRIEPAPHDYASLSGLAKQFGLSVESVVRVIEELNESLGEVRRFKFKYGAPTFAYSPVQQDLIRQKLETEGAFVRMGDDYKPLAAISIELFDTLQRRGSVRAAIDALGDELGDVVTAKGGSGKKPTARYSPIQQEMIRNYLEEKGYMTTCPEGYAAVNGISTSLSDSYGFGVSDGLVSTAIEELGEAVLGKPLRAIGGRYPTDFYSPEQQALIEQHLRERGNFEFAPEGYLSLRHIAASLGVGAGSVEGAVDALGDTVLGEALLARSRNGSTKKPLRHYSPDQQDMIVEWLKQNGRRGTRQKIADIALQASARAD